MQSSHPDIDVPSSENMHEMLCLSANITYREGFIRHTIQNISINKIIKKYTRSNVTYINDFIDFVKENILKKYDNLNEIQIEIIEIGYMNRFYPYHQLILSVIDILYEKYIPPKYRPNLDDLLLVLIYHKENLIFNGIISTCKKHKEMTL
jgi:hypothetical protein